jgi:hypothetical protein
VTRAEKRTGNSTQPDFSIQPFGPADCRWVEQAMRSAWGSATLADHHGLYRPAELPGLVADQGHHRHGLITYHLAGATCEIVTLNLWSEGRGNGMSHLKAVQNAYLWKGCTPCGSVRNRGFALPRSTSEKSVQNDS